ncbi:metallophosphoesterase [Parvularcula sp. ZS-1/3]|uniref:Metallophosphoesterase n=1 Tax=Parvularcula mediterranea TaxID=2732508 RepID=A0A7Y3W5E3_9PROT|nr:metallophosphoesterase [Parvularcula mediterranea]NNU16207.1 metallophosphoesterase [Parvularcula mediterranea]
MFRIAHLSDLHFGAADPAQIEGLEATLHEAEVSHVVVTGDLTQSGFAKEFREAAEWFERLPMPVAAIPGNHDVPVYNLIRRFFAPWSSFEGIIGRERETLESHEGFVFAGLNSARRARPSLDWSTGKLTSSQLKSVGDAFEDEERVRITGFHHPLRGFDDGGSAGNAVIPNTEDTLACMAAAKVDVVMNGHVHKARVSVVEHEGWSFVLSQAGTAISTRLRGEAASFNILAHAGHGELAVEVWRWMEGRFGEERREEFVQSSDGWSAVR